MNDQPAASAAARLALILALCAAPACGVPADYTDAGGHAVILLYHHVAEDTPSSTSVTPRIFETHLRYLADHDYQVVPLSRIITALAEDKPLPQRAVALTFDDAYRSVYIHAAPLLERHGYPYAVFVSTDYIDNGSSSYLSWAQLRELESRGAEIGNHSRAHEHYLHRLPTESPAVWRRRIRGDIQAAQERLSEELERPLAALAYPYGEFSPALTAIAAELGYTAFGQQSGPVGPASDPQALPRFPMASGYAGLDSLGEKLRTRPFRVSVLSPNDPVLEMDTAPPTLRLTLQAPDARLDGLTCFVTGQSAPALKWIDREAATVEVTAQNRLPVGRSKYTCTAPATDGGGVYYWYSHLWMTPPAPGEWYRD
jgi:peptidoglycan/xylan/chitin deacetylase (PgdA/CDA1 family)